MIESIRTEKNKKRLHAYFKSMKREEHERAGGVFMPPRTKRTLLKKGFSAVVRHTAIGLVFTLLLFQNVGAIPDKPPKTGARSVILYELNSDTVLCSENADEKLPVASITKIMTALIVLDNCGLEDEVEIKKEWTLIEGSSSNIKEGRRYTIRQLLYGLLLSSGNDAAYALACHTSGSVSEFAELMNEKAKEFGMLHSSFKNPHGLDERDHYSTAADMALLTAAAMKNKDFALIVSTKEAKIGGESFVNHNKMLWNYKDTVGVKTGYTSLAGRTLVTCANKGDMTLICVTLNDANDWNDHAGLYDWASANYRLECAVRAGETITQLNVISGMSESVCVCAAEDVTLLLENNDKLSVDIRLPRFVYAGVNKGSRVGSADVFVNGEKLTSVDLVFSDTVPVDTSIPLSFWEQIKRSIFPSSEFTHRLRQIIS
ncbi:MAG: D-alanyl-D-alanine carboxypeptidase [Clostridiales bacterium]|nr:D-alanyl-D-alanine carboxypeptidase [Clostridiales bacterium]